MKMLKLTYFISIFIFCIFRVSSASFDCVHDQLIDREMVPISTEIEQESSELLVRSRVKRDTQSNFEPLKIFFYMDTFQNDLPPNIAFNVERAMVKVKDRIASIFKVHNRTKPFRLARTSCLKKWQAGKNYKKCAALSQEPETCSNMDLNYALPDRFLEKQELYDEDNDEPRITLPAGPGLIHSNFIVFITCQESDVCKSEHVSAYGVLCRVDDQTNEPLSGLLNLCPSHFAERIYPVNYYYNVILHEVFHMLGFSHNQLDKFLPCLKGIPCDFPKHTVQEDDNGTTRLVFPLVIKHMQNHFSCSDPNFGGPMAVETENDTRRNYTSHWDPVLMYSSIMMPRFTEYDFVVIDNITLAVFESTGWYRIDYSNADDFIFGKNEGCDFGMNGTCEDSVYLCDPNKTTAGCDILHETIGQCSSLSSHQPCGVIRPKAQGNCSQNAEKEFGFDFYALGYNYKCFMLSKDDELEPSCLPIKCTSEDSYDVRINNTRHVCKNNTVEGEEELISYCPDSSMFCKGTKASLSRDFCTQEFRFLLNMRVHFKLPSFTDLNSRLIFKNFKVTMLKTIAEKMDIPINYIVNSSLTVFKQVYLDFFICPPESVSMSKDFSADVKKVQQFLDEKIIVHILKVGDDLVVSSQQITISPSFKIKFSDYEGFKTLVIVPAICALFIVTTFVASIIRFIHSYSKPTRGVEDTKEP